MCDRGGVITEPARPSLTLRNPAYPLRWVVLAMLLFAGVGNILFEPFSVIRVVAAVFFIGCVGPFMYRVTSVSVRASGDRVVVQNFWRTHTVPVAGIDGFDIALPSFGGGRTVCLVTAAARIPVDVVGCGPRARAESRRRSERLARELTDWVREAQQAATLTG